MRSGEIRFIKASPCLCPAYKDYYIKDRYAGKDIYGHDAYDYALFRTKRFEVIKRFRKRKKAYEYVSKITGLSQWDVRMGSYRIVNSREYLGVQHGDLLYRINRRTGEVATRPLHDEQISSWYDRYSDCISVAKEIVERLELENE